MPLEDSWTCPKCGDKLGGFIGPATRGRLIDDHNYWQHDKPERDRKAEQQRIEWLRSREAPAAAETFDDAFYDGARLTHHDTTMLACFRIGWEQTEVI